MRFFKILIFSLCCTLSVQAQLPIKVLYDSLIQHKHVLNFTIPDIPAFLALEQQSSQLMKPAAPRDLAIMVSGFRKNGEFIIPESFATEFAPALFASRHIRLDKYQQNAFYRTLIKTRISLATRQQSAESRRDLAAGLRITLLDKGDFRQDTVFLKRQIYTQLDEVETQLALRKKAYLKEKGISALEFAENSTLQEAWDHEQLMILQENVEASLKEYKQQAWNASRLELALCTQLSSPDSLLANAGPASFQGWVVYAIKPGKRCDWAQVLFGGQWISQAKQLQDPASNAFSLQGRLYMGHNRLKGFAESHYQYRHFSGSGQTATQSLWMNLGLDINIYAGFWLQIQGGVENGLQAGGTRRLLSSLRFMMSLPENFRFF